MSGYCRDCGNTLCICKDIKEQEEKWSGNPMLRLQFAGHEYILKSAYDELMLKYEDCANKYLGLSQKYLDLAVKLCEVEQLKSSRLKLIRELDKRGNA